MRILEIEGFILAGGASSRMGEDKSRLLLGGKTFVEMISGAIRPLTERITLVSSRPESTAHGLPVVADIHAGLGAIDGLQAALASCEASWALVVSCDLPFVTSALFERLISLRAEEADAVAPVQADGRPQPLCALYEVQTCLKMTEELILSGELRPRELLRRVRTRWVVFEELTDLDGSGIFFQNINTPADYEQARRDAQAAKR